MRDEIQKRPVLLPHRCNRHRILLHSIREIEAVLPNNKEETGPFTKNGLGHSTTKRTFSVPPASYSPLFRRNAGKDTDARFSGAFSVPIGEVNMISITAVEYILYNVNCT